MAAPADDGVQAPAWEQTDEGSAERDDRLPTWAVVALALWFTALLSVWAGFLAPVRVGSVLVPAWLVPVAGMLWLARVASRRAGLWGALGPALVWLGLSFAVLAVRRPEGDLVLPGTTWSYIYLLGSFTLWMVVVALASAPRRRPAQPRTADGREALHGQRARPGR